MHTVRCLDCEAFAAAALAVTVYAGKLLQQQGICIVCLTRAL